MFPEDGLFDTVMTYRLEFKYANGITLIMTSTDQNPHGVKFVGSEGWVFTRSEIDAEPKSLLREPIGPDEIRLPVSTSHHGNFLECVRSRQPTICNIDVAVRSDTICQLAWCAFQLQRPLRWDPEQELFVGDPAANEKLMRSLRAPWGL